MDDGVIFWEVVPISREDYIYLCMILYNYNEVYELCVLWTIREFLATWEKCCCFFLFGACCWSTDDLSTACFSLWCVCCLVGCLLYRSPGATTHTWSDCFSALTRGSETDQHVSCWKITGLWIKHIQKKAAPGNSFKQKEHSIWWQNHAKGWVSVLIFPNFEISSIFYGIFYGIFASSPAMALARPSPPSPGTSSTVGARSGCFAVPAARQQHRQGGHQLAQSYLGPWGDGWNMLKWGRGRDGCRWLVNVSKIL